MRIQITEMILMLVMGMVNGNGDDHDAIYGVNIRVFQNAQKSKDLRG